MKPRYIEIIIPALGALFLLMTSCQNGGSGSGQNTGIGNQGLSSGTSSGSFGSSGPSLNSTGSGSGLTPADTQALNNVSQEGQQTSPGPGDNGLPADLLAQAQQILQAEANGQQVSLQQKMALAAKMMEACSTRVAALAPVPGQPFLGNWHGQGQCAVDFEVSPTNQPGVYGVQGGTNGALQAAADGSGKLATQPFAGSVTDQPTAAHGQVTHPTFFTSKDGTSPCTVPVALVHSTNPIPENYVQAMRVAGQCFKQALVFMSPAFDNMFKNLDPAVAQAIQAQILGIGQ